MKLTKEVWPGRFRTKNWMLQIDASCLHIIAKKELLQLHVAAEESVREQMRTGQKAVSTPPGTSHPSRHAAKAMCAATRVKSIKRAAAVAAAANDWWQQQQTQQKQLSLRKQEADPSISNACASSAAAVAQKGAVASGSREVTTGISTIGFNWPIILSHEGQHSDAMSAKGIPFHGANRHTSTPRPPALRNFNTTNKSEHLQILASPGPAKGRPVDPSPWSA